MNELKALSDMQLKVVHTCLGVLLMEYEKGELNGVGYGICSYLLWKLGDRHQALVAEVASEWPEFSGNFTFPVPPKMVGWPNPFSAMLAISFYHNSLRNKTMWEGEYGEARASLLRFLTNALKYEMERRNGNV